MNESKEKRRNKRCQCYVPVDGKKNSTFDTTRTIDISKNGVGFMSSRSIPINEKIAIELALTPKSEPVLVLGQVKWVSPVSGANTFRIGMQFAEVLSGSRSRLDKYFSTETETYS